MESVRVADGKKFMWDGRTYEAQEAAFEAVRAYESDGFETHLCEQERLFLVYTRRVVTQSGADAPQSGGTT